MRVPFCFLLLLFSISLDAQNILTAENPVAKQYLLTHFGLKGKVMSVTESMLSGTKTLFFDADGRLTMEKNEDSARSYLNETWIYLYDANKKIFNRSKGGALPQKNYYTMDSNSNVTAIYYTSQVNADALFIYQNKLLKTAYYYEKNSSGGKTIAQHYSYTYNESGQLISEIYLNGKKDTVTAKYYKYTVTDGNTLVSIDNASWMNVYRNKKTWIVKKYYDKNNNLIKEEEVAPTNIISYEYKLDKEGNWVERNSHKRQIIYRK